MSCGECARGIWRRTSEAGLLFPFRALSRVLQVPAFQQVDTASTPTQRQASLSVW
jgi:hypothetical protein